MRNVVPAIASAPNSCSTRFSNCRAAFVRSAVSFVAANSYSPASFFRRASIAVRSSDAVSTVRILPCTSARNARISSIDAPYFRFNLSIPANRFSTVSSRAGSASRCPR